MFILGVLVIGIISLTIMILSNKKKSIAESNKELALETGKVLTIYEKLYLRSGFILFLTGPIQYLLFYEMRINTDWEVSAAYPISTFLIWAVPSAIIWSIIFIWSAGGRDNYEDMADTLGVTKFFLFAMHAGGLMILRIIFLIIARKISGNREFRLNTPYILWRSD